MRKIIFISLLAILITSFTSAAFAAGYEIQGGAKVKRVPKGTRIELRATEPVTTQETYAGENFSGTFVNNLQVDNQLVLPQGTLVRGSVQKVKPSKRLSRSAVLYLSFDHVVAPSGRQLPVCAGLCSNLNLTKDGAVSGGGGYGAALSNTWHKSVDIVKNSTQWGIDSGEKLFNGAQYVLTPVAAVGGTLGAGAYLAGGSVYNLFKKGNEVIINQGQEFDILLLEPLDVPAY